MFGQQQRNNKQRNAVILYLFPFGFESLSGPHSSVTGQLANLIFQAMNQSSNF